MTYLLDVAYLLGLLAFSPWLIFKALTTGKYRHGLLSKFFGRAVRRANRAPGVWFHGVSVGEVHLLRPVVARFRQHHPDWQCVVSTTTDTGLEEARKCFADLTVCYWPFDFTWAVRRALRRVRPGLVVLAEGELWPNFLTAAHGQGIPVAVINGRMSPRSLRRYHRLRWLVRRWFGLVDLFAVQTEDYALGFRRLGARPDRVHVTGSVKYDGVEADRGNSHTQALRRLFAVEREDLVWIAGSTQAPEEEAVLDIFCRVKPRHPRLRLIVVPRQKDRFEEVAALLRQAGLPLVRRSTLAEPVRDREAILLMDTIGELGALWGLADLAFVGGSLDGRRGGQNMIEPAAYGTAVVFGPHVWNFRDAATRLVQAGAAVQVADAAGLERAVLHLLGDAAERERQGRAARQFVVQQQGATDRTIALLDRLLVGGAGQTRAA
jgi:3-deoxy-D-manno-octulosonic-acid transferase